MDENGATFRIHRIEAMYIIVYSVSRLQTPLSRLRVSDVLHQAVVAVDESGTEAAATTAISVTCYSASMEQVCELIVEESFFISIHEPSHQLLFAGVCYVP